MKPGKAIGYCFAFLALLFLGVVILSRGSSSRQFAKYEQIAQKAQPLAQAIVDYRNDHGLLPLDLGDISSPAMDRSLTNGWRLNVIELEYCPGGRTYIVYSLHGNEGWEVFGEGFHRKLNVPNVHAARPALSGEALFTAQLNEYEWRISRHPTEQPLYEDKMSFLWMAKRPDLLRPECERAVKLFPPWWLPRMTLAEISESGSDESMEFVRWVHEHPSYMNYFYLARYYRDKNDTTNALAALNQASTNWFVAYPKDSWWTGDALAFDATKIAYENHDFELTLRLCQQWSSRGQGWLAFQAAAEIGLGRFEDAHTHALAARWAENLGELRRAAAERETNFVYRAGPSEWSLFREPRR